MTNLKTNFAVSFYQLNDARQTCFEYTLKNFEVSKQAHEISLEELIGGIVNKFYTLYKIARKHGRNLGVKSTKDIYIYISSDEAEFNFDSLDMAEKFKPAINGVEKFAFPFRLNNDYTSARELAQTLFELTQEMTDENKLMKPSEIGGAHCIAEADRKEKKRLEAELNRANFNALPLKERQKIYEARNLSSAQAELKMLERKSLREARQAHYQAIRAELGLTTFVGSN
jgi:hypothetical protein